MVQIIFVENHEMKEDDLEKYIKNLKYKIPEDINKIYSANNSECIFAAKILLFYNDKNKKLNIETDVTDKTSSKNSIINQLITKLNNLREDDKDIKLLERCGVSKQIDLQDREKIKERLVNLGLNTLILLPASYMKVVDEDKLRDIKLLNLNDQNEINIIEFIKKNGDYGVEMDKEIQLSDTLNSDDIIENFISGIRDDFNFEDKESDKCKRNKIAKNIFIIFMILLLLGAGGYTGYRVIKGGKKSKKKKKYL